MSQAELLTTAKLRLDVNLRRSAPQAGCVLLRAAHGRVRLGFTPAQVDILNRFAAEPVTVSDVLVRMLHEHCCPPLSEYYELVLRSHGAGLLRTTEAGVTVIPTHAWKVRLPPKPAGNGAGVVVLLALLAVGLAPSMPAGQTPVLAWLMGWLLACALLSLGEVLAAGALIGGGGEVRGLHFHWKSLLPAWRVDTAEAAMGGRECVRAVAALRVVPLAVGAAVVAWKLPAGLLPLLVGLLQILAPWGGSALTQWVQSLRERPIFAVQPGKVFTADESDVWADWRGWWAGLEAKSAWAWTGWTVAWSVMLGATVRRYFPDGSAKMLAWLTPTQDLRARPAVWLYALLVVFIIGVLAVGRAAFRHWRIKRNLAQPLRGGVGGGVAPMQGGILEILKQIALFQLLPEEELAVLAGVMTQVQLTKRQELFKENDPGDAFYVVLEGRLEIRKNQPGDAGRASTIGWLGPGEAFGEIALLENTGRTTTIRAAGPSRLLRLAKTDFEQLVIGRVGAARLRELLQYARFLGRLAFLGDWSFDDLIRYAQRCGTMQAPAGKRVLRKGDVNIWFYLIFDGAFEAREGDRVLRRMQPGDYFGEISLLANDRATADVVAVEESRCLTMAREDFLAFFSRDFRIGLRMENQATHRLGKDIFFSRRR